MDILTVDYHRSRGSLCIGSHPCWRWNGFFYGFGELWSQVQDSHDFRSCGPEPAVGSGIESGLWRPGWPGALGILALAGSWVVWVHAWCFCGMRKSIASARCRKKKNAQDLTPALHMAACFFPSSGLGLIPPQRGLLDHSIQQPPSQSLSPYPV